MAGDAGMAILVLGILYMLSKGKAPAVNGNGVQTIYYPYPEPETPEEAEALTQEYIRTRRITVHRTVVTVPTVPTVSQIETARARIKKIDERIPATVRERWGTTQAVQTPGWMPKGEV